MRNGKEKKRKANDSKKVYRESGKKNEVAESGTALPIELVKKKG